MPRLPRDVSGTQLIRLLRKNYRYEPTRQTGSHVRLTRRSKEGRQYLTVPRHRSIKVATLSNILGRVAEQLGKRKAEIIRELFGK